jgi:hypothetical protein
MKFIIILLVSIITLSLQGQELLQIQNNLSETLKETSALVYYNGTFWSINDSGGEPVLYSFDRNGNLIKSVLIKEAQNIDWEALAINNSHIFIGDFGNNFGSRKNLKIYAIELKELEKQEAVIDYTIQFQYPEQTEWIKTKWKTQFDCEAMLATDTSIHLFTKDWKYFNGSHYKLHLKKGTQDAILENYLESDVLITDATWEKDGSFYLIGYKDYIPYILHYSSLRETGYKRRITLKDNQNYQVEGITYLADTLFITTESSAIDASLLFFVP